MGRFTDNDKRLGRYIVYGRTGGWSPYRIVFSTGDTEDHRDGQRPRNQLTLYAWGWCARIMLPWFKVHHHEIKHVARSWDAETIARMGRDWYMEYFPRDYGFSYDKGFLTVYYGPHTHSSADTKSWSHSMGWKGHRQIRHAIYDDEGKLFFDQRGTKQPFEPWYEAKKAVPKKGFLLKDYDGQDIQANTYIDYREWAKGEQWFKWMSWFTKNLKKRSLEIELDNEAGPEKGSYKGGMCGTSIEMLAGETHEQAIRRWCEKDHSSKYKKFRMLFIRALDQPFPDPRDKKAAPVDDSISFGVEASSAGEKPAGA